MKLLTKLYSLNKRVFILFLFPLIWVALPYLLSCNNASHKHKEGIYDSVKIQSKKIVLSDGSGFVKIENTSNDIVIFSFSVNDKFWFSANDLISYIREIDCQPPLSVPREVFNAAVILTKYSFHQSPVMLKEQTLTNPTIILNSLGFGLCDDRSCALVRIWQQMGYRSRCAHLGGHAVSEVFVNGRWIMFDVDNNVFFTNDQSEIQSVEQIGASKDNLVLQQIIDNFSFSQLYFLLNKTQYFEMFSTTYNNGYTDSIPLPEQETEFLSLLPGSYIEFRVTTTESLMPHDALCRIHIPNKSEGLMHIPFVIHHVEGSGLLFSFARAMMPNVNTGPLHPGKYYVSSRGMDVFAYVNPALLVINDTLFVKLKTPNCKNLNVSYISYDEKTDNPNTLSRDAIELHYEYLRPYIDYFDKNPEISTAISIEKIDDITGIACRLYSEVFSGTCNKEKIATNVFVIKSTLSRMKISDKDFIENIKDRDLIKPILIFVNQADTCIVRKSLQMLYPVK